MPRTNPFSSLALFDSSDDESLHAATVSDITTAKVQTKREGSKNSSAPMTIQTKSVLQYKQTRLRTTPPALSKTDQETSDKSSKKGINTLGDVASKLSIDQQVGTTSEDKVWYIQTWYIIML